MFCWSVGACRVASAGVSNEGPLVEPRAVPSGHNEGLGMGLRHRLCDARELSHKTRQGRHSRRVPVFVGLMADGYNMVFLAIIGEAFEKHSPCATFVVPSV